MHDTWVVHPDESARLAWQEAVPDMQVRGELEPCPGARVLILGTSALLAQALPLAPGVPLVVISEDDPEPLYAAGARSVIREPRTPEERQAVVRFWAVHNLA